jgi:hypothetical protein
LPYNTDVSFFCKQEYIDSLPRVAAPEVYGFHANADIAKDVKDTEIFLDSFGLTQSRDSGAGGQVRISHFPNPSD